jgi:hypothetical protein
MAIETAVGNDIVLYVDVAEGDEASLTIGTTTAGVVYTANRGGDEGNNIRVAHVEGTGNNAPLSVDVIGSDITVTLATDGTGTANSTANAVIAAVNNDPEASALVTASPLSTGAGVAAEAALAALSGGADASVSDFEMIGYQRDISREQTRELIDASHKGSDHAQSVYGRMESTLSLDALVPDPEAGSLATHNRLWDAQQNKQSFLVQYIQRAASGNAAANVVRQAEALIGSISEEGPDNDVATLSMELTLQGPLRVV